MGADESSIYPGDYVSLMRFLERRQRPFENAADLLPPLTSDLTPLWDRTVPAATLKYSDTPRYDIRRKHLELQKEFEGAPQILHLHALLIAISRRNKPPPAAMPLFFRIWREEGRKLADTLSVRWLISATTTFADCGETGDQRALGMGLSTLFDLIKLHDSERRCTGKPGHEKMKFVRHKHRPPLGLDMPPYSIEKGDLDKVLLARLWQLAERERTMRPLAMRMLRMLMNDRATVFARMQAYKAIE
ncbi:hypothetical protein [Tateyamaria sp. ANG-S1]|uniref:hypothetical protein n=1 Tax=Tateyamaria sp. ANG-S1 TaxID=1577905 RepID=UPI00057EC1C1|nr:hypothetical protein [Tateyamaria sp. ANG-S1]KIC48512.1 hypothetical protein RA29_12280 [Tateyamaria sp. ANG-S1]